MADMTKTRTLLLIIFMVMAMMTFDFMCNNAHAQCSIYGDKNLRKFQILDSLKNRNFTECLDSSVTLEKILTFKGDDRNSYNSCQYVPLTGYIILVKYGGPETCNCHSKDKKDLDIHIELALSPDAKGKNAMVCEVNRYTQLSEGINIADIKKLVGKKVTIEGFMFLDEEHLQNAVTTNPTGTNLWRYTCWEQHPAMSIKLTP